LADAFWQAADGGRLPALALSPNSAVTTVLAARGYPDRPEKGAAIAIPANLPDDVMAFHAGTRLDEDGTLRTAGGRVLAVTAVRPTFAEAQAASRAAAEQIEFSGKQFRRDIGWREAARR
jgi:phosphoribosylamine--glycine ligase